MAVNYQTREDLDILFTNSSRVLEYLDGEDVEKPLFLAMVTDSQMENIAAANLPITVIERDASLGRFVLLYHPKPDQSGILEGMAERVIPISQHYTLVKYSEGKTFEHTGPASSFFDIPFAEVVVTPPLRTKTAIQPQAITSPPAKVSNELQPNTLLVVGIGILAFVLILGGTFFLIKKRRRKAPPMQQEPSISGDEPNNSTSF